jgi:ketosteroid isomerase-like protein
MSKEMQKRLDGVYQAINCGDFDAAMDALEPIDPHIVWVPPPDAPDTRHAYRGRDGVKKRLMELAEPFQKRAGRVVEFVAVGNRAFIDAHLKGEGKGSEVPFEGHLYQVITTRDPGETVVRVDNFFDRKRALEAAGLSE